VARQELRTEGPGISRPFTDRWGVPVQAASEGGAVLLDEAIEALVAPAGDPVAGAEGAVAADDELVLGHIYRAYLLLYGMSAQGVASAGGPGGLALLEGFSAFAAGRPGRAIDLMIDIRARASAVGGSHPQRDVIDLTLIAAAARAVQHSLGQALIAERVAREPSAAAAARQLLTENARTAMAGIPSQGPQQLLAQRPLAVGRFGVHGIGMTPSAREPVRRIAVQ
jgi:hypothetical protein